MARGKVEFKFESSERITPPNHEMLAKLTKRAMGDRTTTAFAKICNTSLPTMSRFVNGQSKSAMSDALILAIAENADSDSGVTLELLQEANGILVKSPEDKRTVDAPSYGMVFEKTAREIVLNELALEGFVVKISNQPDRMSSIYVPDFEIETDALAEFGIKSWQFEVLFTNNGPLNIKRIDDKLSRIFAGAYLNPSKYEATKITLITDSIETFNYVVDRYKDYTIPHAVSVVLIEVAVRKAIDEFQIPMTNENFDKLILTRYKNY